MRRDGRWLARISAVGVALAMLSAPAAAGAAGSVYVATAGVGMTPGTVAQYGHGSRHRGAVAQEPRVAPRGRQPDEPRGDAGRPQRLCHQPDRRVPAGPGQRVAVQRRPRPGALTPKALQAVVAGLSPW